MLVHYVVIDLIEPIFENRCCHCRFASCLITVPAMGNGLLIDYPLSYGVPVREQYGSTLLPATREQHDQNCTQSH